MFLLSAVLVFACDSDDFCFGLACPERAGSWFLCCNEHRSAAQSDASGRARQETQVLSDGVSRCTGRNGHLGFNRFARL